MKGKLIIEIKAKEQELLENFLNLALQGFKEQAILFLVFYAMEKQWQMGKLIYYFREGEVQ